MGVVFQTLNAFVRPSSNYVCYCLHTCATLYCCGRLARDLSSATLDEEGGLISGQTRRRLGGPRRRRIRRSGKRHTCQRPTDKKKPIEKQVRTYSSQ